MHDLHVVMLMCLKVKSWLINVAGLDRLTRKCPDFSGMAKKVCFRTSIGTPWHQSQALTFTCMIPGFFQWGCFLNVRAHARINSRGCPLFLAMPTV